MDNCLQGSKQGSEQGCEPGFYLIVAGLALLLAVSEGLGILPTEYNGIIDLLLKLLNTRSNKT